MTLDLGNGFFKVDPSVATDADVIPLLPKLSPSGLLAEIAAEHANPELDAALDEVDREQDRFDKIDAAVARHLAVPGIAARLEDDLALATPAIVDAVNTIDGYWIPLLSAIAGPAAPLVSFGIKVAIALALAALKAWSARRLAAKKLP